MKKQDPAQFRPANAGDLIGETSKFADKILKHAAAARDDKGDPIVIRWQRGFCHRDFVPAEEIMQASTQAQHQSDEQRKEAIALRRVAFRKLKGWLK